MKTTIKTTLAALLLTTVLTACSGHSAANKEQISNAKQEAEEMLDQIHNNTPTAPTAADTAATAPEITPA